MKPSSDDVKPVKSADWRPAFNAGLARIIDRERHSYQQLAQKVAADETLAQATRSEVLQTNSPRMVDAGVQSDHAVDLLVATPCPGPREVREEKAVLPANEDKATITDEDWLLVTGSAEVVADSADDVEHLVVENAGTDTTSAPSKPDQPDKEQNVVIPGRSVSSGTGQKLHKVHWAISVDECRHEISSPVRRRSENFADELLLPAPWATRASITQLGPAGLERHKAVLARSVEHMVVIEVETSEDQSKEEAATRTDVADESMCDRVATEGVLNDKVGQNLNDKVGQNLNDKVGQNLNDKVGQNLNHKAGQHLTETSTSLVESADGKYHYFFKCARQCLLPKSATNNNNDCLH